MNTSQVQEIKIEVYGRVQSVGFRNFVKIKADELKLTGQVMNHDDGSVHVIAQGKREKLESFLELVQKGPLFSKVSGVSYFWREPRNEYETFIIALDKNLMQDQQRNIRNLGKSMLHLKNKIPRHLAIIPDGNRRWAKKNGFDIFEGHKKSAEFENLVGLFEESRKLGIKYITFWAFSTENWNRDQAEVSFLFELIGKFSEEFQEYAIKNNIRFRHLGRKDRLPKIVKKQIENTQEATKTMDGFFVQICLDYGGRDEIIRAVNKMLKAGVQEINEDDLSNYLDSTGIPDPDLIIRTSGERRLSGFMSYQSAYSEYHFANVDFPEFGPKELRIAVEEFSGRKRNYGK